MEDFVTFEIAKKLREKGFKEKCLCCYINNNDITYNIEYPVYNNQMWFSHNSLDNLWHRDIFDVPTISQVLKWLRKEKNIHLSVDAEREDWFEYKIVQLSRNTRRNSTRVYENYEDAIIAGIEYVLDNLI